MQSFLRDGIVRIDGEGRAKLRVRLLTLIRSEVLRSLPDLLTNVILPQQFLCSEDLDVVPIEFNGFIEEVLGACKVASSNGIDCRSVVFFSLPPIALAPAGRVCGNDQAKASDQNERLAHGEILVELQELNEAESRTCT